MELTTEQGWRFSASAELRLEGHRLDMDTMTTEQKHFLADKLKEAAFNAAFTNQAEFLTENPAELKKLFP